MGGAHPPAQWAVIGLLSRHSPAEKTMSRKAALRPWGRQAVPDGRERRGWPRGPRHEERRKGLVSRRQKDRGTRRFKVTDGSRGLRLFQSRVLNNYSMKILRQKKQKITTSASFSDEHTAWGRRRRRRAALSVKHATQTSSDHKANAQSRARAREETEDNATESLHPKAAGETRGEETLGTQRARKADGAVAGLSPRGPATSPSARGRPRPPGGTEGSARARSRRPAGGCRWETRLSSEGEQTRAEDVRGKPHSLPPRQTSQRKG